MPPQATGNLTGFEILGWYGMLAPLRTPPEVIAKVNADVMRTLKSPEVQEKLIVLGAEAAGSSPADFGAFLRRETVKWTKLLRDANIRPSE